MEKNTTLHRFSVLMAWYLEHLTINHYRPRTIQDYTFELSFFRRWVEENDGTVDIDDFSPALLHGFAAGLYNRGLSSGSINHKLTVLKSFFDALYEHNKLYIDLGRHISLPRVLRGLPKNILSEKEMSRVFAYLESITSALTVRTRAQAVLVRDHALMEVLYSTAIRKTELITLMRDDINHLDRLVHIRGKGGKHRIVPMDALSLSVLQRYIREARGVLTSRDIGTVFVTLRGGAMGAVTVLDAVKRVVAGAGIKRTVTVHGIRHCSATHMLNRGADIRYVQELLGHESVSTTQIYTHVSINKLKQTHARYHPGERKDFRA